MKKSKEKIDKSKKTEKEEVKTTPSEEKVFDFGGLPKRDLKKNLGCG
jgi:hypothetical protein